MITRSHRAYGMNEYFRPTLEYVRAGRTRKNGHRFLSIRFLFLVAGEGLDKYSLPSVTP